MLYWIKSDLYNALCKEANNRAVKADYLLQESITPGVNQGWTGKKFPLKSDRLLIPKEFLGSIPENLELKYYRRYYSKEIFEVIHDWPKMTNARFVQRMIIAFPDAHPGVWHLREIRKAKYNDPELLVKFGAMNYRSLHFDKRWDYLFNCEVLK
ncbi:hypothetical protein [Yersinia phage vB_YenM_P744]